MKSPSLILLVDEIPEAGRTIAGRFPASWLGDSVLDAYTIEGDLEVRVEAKRLNESVYVEGRLALALSFECSRTLAPGRTQLDVHVSELYQPAALHALNLGAGLDPEELDADEPYTYDSGRIDLEPLLREQLVLAQDPFPTVEGPSGPTDKALWSSGEGEVDPRWAKLQDIELA